MPHCCLIKCMCIYEVWKRLHNLMCIIQSNLCLKTTNWKRTIWSLFTGGLSFQGHFCRKRVIARIKVWLLKTGNCYKNVVFSTGLTVYVFIFLVSIFSVNNLYLLKLLIGHTLSGVYIVFVVNSYCLYASKIINVIYRLTNLLLRRLLNSQIPLH